MGKYSRSEVEYLPDQGYVRLNLRRPVILYVPSELLDSYNPATKTKKPTSALQIEWVYGYRGKDCRSNLFPLASGEIIYFIASVVVIWNPEEEKQRHYTGHTDDIKCLTLHPDGKTVATGQIKGREGDLPHVRIWDSESLDTLHSFGQETFSRGVSCIAFNKSGELLAAVDEAQGPRLSIWKWEDESTVAEAKASADTVIGVSFTEEASPRIVTAGKSHFCFWTLSDEGNLSKKSGVFGDVEKPSYVTAVVSRPSGDVITGDSNGNIIIWGEGDNTVKQSIIGAHEGTVFSLGVSEGETIISAGKDRKIVLYNSDYEPTGESVEIPEEFGSPRAVFKLGDNFYVGTTKNYIIKTTLDADVTIITEGHTEELWGLAAHHSEPHFITAGQDGNVYFRDAMTHKIIWSKTFEMACQSADFSSNKDVVVIGGSAGKWVAIVTESQEIFLEGVDGDEIIQVTRFSPDGTKLALGSRDNKVYIYDFDEDKMTFTKRGECEGHSSFITHLDWSIDGEMVRTNSGDYEVLVWKVEDCSLAVQSEDYKDVTWATETCILAFNTIGIWPPGTDGTHINSCCKAKEKDLLVTGDDFGILKLFNYPTYFQNAKFNGYHGHSSHITRVVFSVNDSFVLSAGGRDTAIIQWKVVDAEEGEAAED